MYIYIYIHIYIYIYGVARFEVENRGKITPLLNLNLARILLETSYLACMHTPKFSFKKCPF